MKVNKPQIVSDLLKRYGMSVTRDQIQQYVAATGIGFPYWVTDRDECREARGKYTLKPLCSLYNVDESGACQTPAEEKTEGVLLPEDTAPEVSDEDLLDTIRERFNSLDRFAEAMIDGKLRSVIVSGNAGIGKTHILETALDRAAADGKILFRSVKGYVKATGLYKLFWEHRFENAVLVFDDADSIFQDEVALNLLKSGLDTTRRRRVSWLSERSFEDEGGDKIPDTFEFNGCVGFITNLDFDKMSKSERRLAPHFQALMSRTYYMDLNLRTAREMMLRIKDVIQNTDMLRCMTLSEAQCQYILVFMEENMMRLRELSLRMAIKLGHIALAAKSERDFIGIARTTCMIR